MKKIIHTEKAPGAIGPYSQGVQIGGLLFVSGQIPMDPATGAFAGEDVSSQTRQALKNVSAILEAAGYTCADVVKTTVLLADMADFAAMNEVYAEFFQSDCPARAAFAVKDRPNGAKVEIEAIAGK